jgi:hypothetical protein
MTTTNMLLIEIFRASCSFGDDKHLTSAQFLAEYDQVVKATGRLLTYIGLAEQDEKSDLGWEPTPHLISIIAKKAARELKPSKCTRTSYENFVLGVLLDAALGDDKEVKCGSRARLFASSALAALGLLRNDDEGIWRPTALLRELLWQQKGS